MLHGKFFQHVIGAVAFAAALSANAQVVPLDSVVAIVDEDIILSSEVRDRVQQIKLQPHSAVWNYRTTKHSFKKR